jgi:CubicO group peptidase (beta-lactamase class C family)
MILNYKSNISIIIYKAMCLVIVLSLFSCNEKKGRRIVIKPQAVIKEEEYTSVQIIEPSEKTNIVDSFFTAISSKNDFNGTVLVTHKNKIIYKKAFGYSNFKSKDTLTENSIFQLASVSKQFTAVSIMMLHEQGLLNYNDEVSKFFPDFPYKGITIKLLLSHRSGLPNYMYFCDEFYKDKHIALTNMGMIDLMIKNKPPEYFPPDKKFNYCNTNYCILAAIVEKVSKQTFANYVTNRIFKPIGMHYSFIGNQDSAKYAQYVASGHDENNKPIKWDYMDGILGDKGIFSCVNDLNKWDMALYSGKIIKESTLAEAMQPANQDMIGSRNYGYGWRIKYLADKTPLFYHGGWWKGYNTYFMRNPKDHSSIIILSNKVNWSFNSITAFIPRFYNQKPTREIETI